MEAYPASSHHPNHASVTMNCWLVGGGLFELNSSEIIFLSISNSLKDTRRGWSAGAKVLGKLPGPGCPTSFDKSRTRAYCACSK